MRQRKNLLTSVRIEPTTSGIDLPSLCRLSYKVAQTFSVRPCSSVGRVTVDLFRRSWVRFPPRSKDFFFASCGSLFPFTRAKDLNLHFRVSSLFFVWLALLGYSRHPLSVPRAYLIRCFSLIPANNDAEWRSGWTKIQQMYENIHFNLALVLLFQRTEVECGKAYKSREQSTYT